MTRLKTSFRGYLRDESGVLLAEFLILIPMVIWGFLALFVYWDVFKTINITQKAAYSISDLLSRQIVVNEDFLDGQQEILDFLTPNVPESRIRITSMEMDEGLDVQTAWDGDDEYVLLFSHSPGDKVPLRTQASIQELTAVVPTLQDLESVIIVETWVDYAPDFDIGVLNMAPGLAGQTFTQFIVTKPRTKEVCLDGTAGCV